MELPKSVLIVDDQASVLRSLARVLGLCFESVYTAITAGEASLLLETKSVTHIVCDYWLGHGQPVGLDLIPGWRKNYPSIERAIILSGSDPERIVPVRGIDAVLSKTVGLDELMKHLSEEVHGEKDSQGSSEHRT